MKNIPTFDENMKVDATTILPYLTAALDKLYNENRTGVHVSDLVLCPRKAAFRRFNPSKTTPRELNFFTMGKSLHQVAQDLTTVYPEVFTQEQEAWVTLKGDSILLTEDQMEIVHMFKKSSDWEGLADYYRSIGINPDEDIVAHIDIYNRRENVPVEMKGIRKASIEQAKDFQAQQLKYYMAMTGAKSGVVLYQLIMHFKDKPFKEFIISLDENQLAIQKANLVKEGRSFAKALKAKDPRLARPVIKDENLNWQCDDCPFLKYCQDWEK